MAMFPSGNFTFSPSEKYQRDAIVSGPRRPIYIIKIEISLLVTQRLGVIPVDSPTVPKALVISKSASINRTSGSKHTIKYVETITTPIASRVMTDAFLNAFLGMA
jgi:hypothetical protein